MAGSVGHVAASITPTVTTSIAGAAAETVTTVAPAVAATAARAGFSGTGWLGVGAGTAGIAITLLDAWKNSVGTQRGPTAGSLVNPTTVAIFGGAALLGIGEKTGATNLLMRNGLRGAGIALVLGGLAGAVVGALNTFGNPLKQDTEAITSSQSQAPVRFGTTLPLSPASLAGVEVASADVIDLTADGRSQQDVPVYVDPSTAKALPKGATLGEAIGAARAAAQSDGDSFRSHAVIETNDGTYWTMRLTGGLDQVDGPKYTDGTKFDKRYDPEIGRRQQAIQAIAGVEGYFPVPDGMEPTAPLQYTGDIPWVTPTLAGVKPAATISATPAAPAAPPTATPAAPATGS